jgi:hypothetical protein
MRPTAELRARADELFAAALESGRARDPREHFRGMLLELKAKDAAAFRRAVGYHDTGLLPAIVEQGEDPLRSWIEYGRVIAELLAPGRTVVVFPDGTSGEYPPPAEGEPMVLHLPSSAREPARILALPARLSPAQRATIDLLVRGSLGS